MQKLKVAASPKIRNILDVEREVLDLNSADLTEISAVVIDLEDYRNGRLKRVDASAFGLPIFLMLNANEETPKELIGRIVGALMTNPPTAVCTPARLTKPRSVMKTKFFPRSLTP